MGEGIQESREPGKDKEEREREEKKREGYEEGEETWKRDVKKGRGVMKEGEEQKGNKGQRG